MDSSRIPVLLVNILCFSGDHCWPLKWILLECLASEDFVRQECRASERLNGHLKRTGVESAC